MSESTRQADVETLNREVREIWDSKAEFWDEQVGEGNLFQRVLIGPASERLLQAQPGQVILDVACGNGVFSRRLASLGAQVVAMDFSARFLERARARTTEHPERIEYRVLDATDEDQLLALGEGRFDAAVCNMALMDMATIDPLLRALARLLKPEGCFVFSVLHPAFNSSGGSILGLERDERDGRLAEVYYVKVFDYLHIPAIKGAGMPDEPMPHYYFHRSISTLFSACFAAGFAIDGVEEPAFGADDSVGRPFGWAHYTHIPPVLVARARFQQPGR